MACHGKWVSHECCEATTLVELAYCSSCVARCNHASHQDANCLQGMLPIHYAVKCGSEQETMKVLLAFGVKDARNNEVSLVGLYLHLCP